MEISQTGLKVGWIRSLHRKCTLQTDSIPFPLQLTFYSLLVDMCTEWRKKTTDFACTVYLCVTYYTGVFQHFFHGGKPKIIFHVPSVSSLYRVERPVAQRDRRVCSPRLLLQVYQQPDKNSLYISSHIWNPSRYFNFFYLIFFAETLIRFRGTPNDISWNPNDISRNP